MNNIRDARRGHAAATVWVPIMGHFRFRLVMAASGTCVAPQTARWTPSVLGAYLLRAQARGHGMQPALHLALKSSARDVSKKVMRGPHVKSASYGKSSHSTGDSTHLPKRPNNVPILAARAQIGRFSSSASSELMPRLSPCRRLWSGESSMMATLLPRVARLALAHGAYGALLHATIAVQRLRLPRRDLTSLDPLDCLAQLSGRVWCDVKRRACT